MRQFLLLILVTLTMAKEEQCSGKAPMKSVASFMGMSLDYEMADRICCHNHIYAEPSGYLETVGLFSKLDPNKETTFYDSVCGIPLFVAPRGRTFEEFEKESLNHGWPSFRPEELVGENVIIHKEGRMESKCGTHLGHNLPDDRDRYCIDLVCVAGVVPERPFDHGSVEVLEAADFDASTYESSASQWSGKYSKTKERIIMSVAVVSSLAVVAYGANMLRNRYLDRQKASVASIITKELSYKDDSDEEGEFS